MGYLSLFSFQGGEGQGVGDQASFLSLEGCCQHGREGI